MNRRNSSKDFEDDPQVKRRLEEAAERAKDQELKVVQIEKEIESLKASGSSSDRQDQQKHGQHGITGGMKDTLNKGKNMGKDIVGGVKDKLSGQNKNQGLKNRGNRDQDDDDDDDFDGGHRRDSRDRSRGHNTQDNRR